MRPGYVSEVYDTVFSYVTIDGNSKVCEVGSGAGQATEPILRTGCGFCAVELGANFCKMLSEKFSPYPGFSVINGRFEDTEFEDNSFDLVYSASAFHWVPEKLGYEKVYSMLKEGGAFARFANHPHCAKDDPALREDMDKLYAEYYYTYHKKEPKKAEEYTKDDACARAEIALKYGFSDVRYELFYRKRSFSADEYAMLLGTYSDHIAIEESTRNTFFGKIRDTINDHGGTISIFDIIDLQLARKGAER